MKVTQYSQIIVNIKRIYIHTFYITKENYQTIIIKC